MAGIVVKGRFPRRRIVAIVASNVFRSIFERAARSWLRNASSTAPALGSMTLLLLMSGLIGLCGFSLHNLEQTETTQASLLHVYLRDDVTGADTLVLMNLLESDPRVASVTYTTKAEALQRAQSIPGLPELAASSDSNPFPASLDVQVKSIDQVAAVDALVRSRPQVDPQYPTSYDQGAYQRIQRVLYGLSVAGVAFLCLLGFVAVTVTANAIRGAIHSRRDEIAIMQLVGAPRWMVRGPFVVEGAITGLVAGLVAGLVIFGLTFAAITLASGPFMQFAPGVSVTVCALASVAVLLAGIGLGSGSSVISVRRHMEA